MVAKTEVQATKLDSLKLAIALGTLVLAIVGFYYFEDQPIWVRALLVIAGAGVALAVVYTTALGKKFWDFAQDSKTEVRKVVWPTRQETVQTTMMVMFMVLLMGIFMWLLDMFLMWVVKLLTGQGG